MLDSFYNNGVTDLFYVNLEPKLKKLQNLIYDSTKELLISHSENLEVEEKLKLPFKEIPSSENWSKLMNLVNSSNELNELINCESVIKIFKKIFKKPIKYEICTFRARYPSERRVIYNWHQDEGTWYLSKNKKNIKKFTATMWLSVNGCTKNNSIQIIKDSHKNKLYKHSYVSGQGYFNANLDEDFFNKTNNIITIEAKPSEAVLFHPLTLHRSVTDNSENIDIGLVPRYSIDIRYFDESKKLNYSTSYLFKLKKLINKI